MPINIYEDTDYKQIEYLCEDIWELPGQVYALEEWLKTKGAKLPKGSYVADIGFDIRKDASGGGAALSPEAMQIMAEKGMYLFLSEYPNSVE